MATLQQFKQELTMAVTQHHGCCTRTFVYAHGVCEIVSHLFVLVVAWDATAYVIAPYFLGHYGLALLASDLHWQELLQAPLLWLFPAGSSRLVAPSQGGRIGPNMFRVFSWCLRLAVLGCWLWAVQFDPEIYPDCTESHDCDSLPFWLRKPWWSQEPTCPVTGNSYTKCLEETPWYRRGLCNQWAGGCYLEALPAWLGIFAGVPLFFGPFLALPMSLLLSVGLCCCRAGPLGQQELTDGGADRSDDEPEVTLFKQLKFFALFLFPFVLDVFSDLNGILQYILTGNFLFAIVSAGIFAMSIVQQLRRGILHKFCQAASESMRQGRSTDDLEIIMLSEKSVEAAMQLMLQYYAFWYVTSSEVAVWSFLFSMAFSLRSAANAVYYLIELDLYHAIAKRQYEHLT